MSTVVLDVSMSLDGFIAKPNDEIEPLHDWLFRGDVSSRHSEFLKPEGVDRDLMDEAIDTLGATVTGRRTYELSNGWGGKPLFGRPVFVVSHRAPDEVADGYTFVTEGVESAVEQAHAVAGDRNIGIMGASVAQQCLRAGLLDELEIHVVPVLLGKGIRLFEDLARVDLETTRVLESPGVTHIRFRVLR